MACPPWRAETSGVGLARRSFAKAGSKFSKLNKTKTHRWNLQRGVIRQGRQRRSVKTQFGLPAPMAHRACPHYARLHRGVQSGPPCLQCASEAGAFRLRDASKLVSSYWQRYPYAFLRSLTASKLRSDLVDFCFNSRA